MGFVHERGLLSRKKAKSPAESSAGLFAFQEDIPCQDTEDSGSHTGRNSTRFGDSAVISCSALDDGRTPGVFTKKGSLQRLPERSGEEIRTLDTAGMNRML